MNKHLILAIAATLITSLAFSQENTTTEAETSSIIYDGSNYGFAFFWDWKKPRVHLPGLSFTFVNMNGLEDEPYADLKEHRSYSVGLSLGSYSAPLSKNWVLGTGVRLDFTRYHFKGNVGLDNVQFIDQQGFPLGKTYTAFVPDPEGRDYKSSKMILYYISVPLVVEYQTQINRGKVFFINAGMEGLLKYYTKSQIHVKRSGGSYKETLADPNIPIVSARFVCNIGFGSMGLTAYYQPFSMFKDNRGPEVYPWGVGFAVGF